MFPNRSSKKKKSHLYTELFLLALCILLLIGCKAAPQSKNGGDGSLVFTDDLDRRVILTESPNRVVALSASLAETWMLAGGSLVGTTSDAHARESFTQAEDVLTIGTIKDPNSEAVIALDPDFVLLSADIPSHLGLSPLLTKCAIPHAYFHVETMDEYLYMLQRCTSLTGEKHLYKSNGLDVMESCNKVITTHMKGRGERGGGTYLLLRSYSTKVKAKGGDNMVSGMLGDLGCTNLTSLYPSLLEELSMETIIWEDPTYIFVIPMGDERAAEATMEHMLVSNPAFAALDAVQKGRYHLLPKDLFHYKPNNRWGESYAYLAKLLTQ